MFSIPTDRIYKFLAVASLISSLIFVLFPDVYAYYSKKQVIAIEIKRIELSQGIFQDEIRLQSAKSMLQSSNKHAHAKAKAVIDSVLSKALARKVEIASIDRLCSLQKEIQISYEYWLDKRIAIIVFSLVVFILSSFTWIIMDIFEIRKS